MKALRWLDDHLEEYILAVLLVVISCVMMLQIVMRYVFNSSLPWPEELTRYCFVWSGFLGIGYSIKRGLMLKIDVIFSLFPKKVQKVLDIFSQVVMLVFFSYMFVMSIDVFKKVISSGQTSPALRLPMSYVYASLLAGFALAAIRSVQSIALTFMKKPTAGTAAGGTND
ncbi:MAG TPA: TRAP transporter small permease [Bacillota bacterium]|nr:TRAP transporter small permease [Bacillota bacterium]HOA15146.1 TRAP transporter small permease [Bacillota bacterium]HOG53041.1 TRAP transporter small permease [Bacillota bacterium]